MKNNIVSSRIIPLVVCIIASMLNLNAQVRAQSFDSVRTSEERAKAITEEMKSALSLTDDQYQKVYTINIKYAKENEQITQSDDGKLSKYQSLKSAQNDRALK